MSKLGHK